MAEILGLAHIGIFVKDLEVSKKFYRDTLGCSVIHDATFEEHIGTKKIFYKIAFIRAGDATLELIQSSDYKKLEDGTIDHIALKVKDIESTTKRLRAKGIIFDTEKTVFGPTFFDKGSRWIFFRGPDGEHLEINQVL